MRTLLRSLLAVLLGLCAVLPVLGGEECGGGEGGVWILPRSSVLTGTGGRLRQLNLARNHHHFDDISKGVSFEMSSEIGIAVAVLSDPQTNSSQELSISGHVVQLAGTFLTNLRNSGTMRADILVSDENGNGYLMVLVFDATGVTVYVF